jgi:hypothetical protein
MKKLICLCVSMFLAAFPVFADNGEDLSLIKETARNYMEAWYQGDASKMKKSLHKKLAKRSVKTGFDGNTSLGFTSASSMISYTRSGYGKQLWEENLDIKVTVLDQHDNIASVLVVSPHYYEYLHLAKTDNAWVIINALYE